LAAVFFMSFFRHREIFQSDVIRSVRERRNRRSPAHRLDEFPVGYSSASCTPALLASASPTGIHSATQARRRQTSFQPTANSVLTSCVTSGDNRKPGSLSFTGSWARTLLVLADKERFPNTVDSRRFRRILLNGCGRGRTGSELRKRHVSSGPERLVPRQHLNGQRVF
jgi:hypothetical protein